MKKRIVFNLLGPCLLLSRTGALKRVLLYFFLASMWLLYPRADLNADKPAAQDVRIQASPQHVVTVTLKLVQVYVTDRKGNPILDLKKDDFVISDNGKKQSLTEFERHVLSFAQAAEEAPPAIPVETPLPAPRELISRKFFLLFDFAFNNAIGLEKAKRAALHFIDTQLQPTDEVGALSYSAIKSLKLHEYLTTDHRKVRDSVKKLGISDIAGRAEDFEAKFWALVQMENPRDASSSGHIYGLDKQKDEQQRRELEFLRQQRQESKLLTYNLVRKMTDLAKAMRYIPGKKSVIFFSSGVPYSVLAGLPAPEHNPSNPLAIAPKPRRSTSITSGLEEDSQEESMPERFESSHLASQYEDMAKELGAANCAIYALDAQELRSNLDSSLQTRGTFSLQKMTSATGGKYFGNINNYERHLERIQDLTGCYYVLGYYVDDKWDGAYHKIKVEVNRQGCPQIADRRSY